MNYKVLYRKYRPDDFENIIGQEYIVKTLKNSIINQNIAHAYIFSGPRGTGKTSTAKVFSKTLNCLNNSQGVPCNNCEFCNNFNDNPDIIEIDAASNNGVDEIRNLIDNIKLTPTNGVYKVYIIDEVHMLTTSAFNALLLTLEEPPKHVIFILATTNIESVPITILSRCQRYDFQKIKIEDIVKRLNEICKKENIEAEEDALEEIAYISDGGMRDALSLLDQLSKNNQKITLELVEKQIKVVSKKMLLDLLDTIEENNVDNFLNIVDEFRIKAIDYKSLIKRLIELSSVRAKNIKLNGKYSRLDFNCYKNIILNLTECINKVNINVDPYTILEMELLEFFNLKQIENYKKKAESVLEENVTQTNVSENNGYKQTVDISVKPNDKKLVDIRMNNCFVNAQKQFLEKHKELLSSYQSSNIITGKIKSILLDSTIVVSSDKYVVLTCDTESIANCSNKEVEQIEQDLKAGFNKDIKLIFISHERWLKEKQKYIENLKRGVKYTLIEEKNISQIDEIEITDVFDKSKIEII